MAERVKRVIKQEPYTYSLYVPSQKSERLNTELESRSPDEYFLEEPLIAEDSSAMMGLESSDQGLTTEEAVPSQDLESTHSHGIYKPKHHSLRRTSRLFGKLHFGGNMRIRIGAVGGWSAMAGAGAVALLTRAGPFPGTQLTELGAVWGGIAAFLWIIIAKLKK